MSEAVSRCTGRQRDEASIIKYVDTGHCKYPSSPCDTSWAADVDQT